MKSEATPCFWTAYHALPADVRELARKAYIHFKNDPLHPGLQFKKIRGQSVSSVRITTDYRALGFLNNGGIVWFWIGSHSDYDRMIAGL